MMIQRIQSLYLIVAAIMMSFFCNSTIGIILHADDVVSQISLLDYPVLLIVNIVIAVLLFVAIFLYKNTRRQKTVVAVSMLLIVASLISCGFIVYSANESLSVEYKGGAMLIGALVLSMCAYRGITRDEKLLRDADRIR